MKVLLTGATGFIGSQLARLAVSQGHSVTAIVRPGSDRRRIRAIEGRLHFIEQDLADLRAIEPQLAGERPDLCLHLAWRGWANSQAAAEENLTSLALSLEFMRVVAQLGCPRFVSAGTCLEYDPTLSLFSETTPTPPHDLYGTSKRAFFDVAEQFSRLAKLEVVWTRLFYSYGPYQDRGRLVPAIVLGLLRGEPFATTAGEQVRDYLHVEDVASAIWHVAQSRFTGAVNIASGTSITVRELASEVGRLMGRLDLLRFGALPYREDEPMVIQADASLLRDRLGWSPHYNLETGIAATVAWWQEAIAPEQRQAKGDDCGG